MTRVFVLTNHKVGVGKSTSATNIAYSLVGLLRRSGAANCRVLLVDTDSQAHASLVTIEHKDYGADNRSASWFARLLDRRPLSHERQETSSQHWPP